MKKLVTAVLFLAIMVFSAIAAAQLSPQYTESSGIYCGNAVCEHMFFKLKTGEEKSVDVAGKTYSIKFVRAEKVETPYLNYNIYLSIDGSSPMLVDEARKILGDGFNAYFYESGPEGPNLNVIAVNLYEDRICAVPDCAFNVELKLNKKWNLVPAYFLQREDQLKKGTCKLQDIAVIYGYNPLNNSYLKLLSYGKVSESASEYTSISQSERILAGTPFNSVWLYSNSECKLTAELPKQLENFLLVLAEMAEDKKLYVPVQLGQEPPPPQVQPGLRLAAGWNFLIGGKDIEGKSLDEVRGNCNIEKAFTFDAALQSWKKLTAAPGIASNFVFKVTSKCMLGHPEIAPPPAPS